AARCTRSSILTFMRALARLAPVTRTLLTQPSIHLSRAAMGASSTWGRGLYWYRHVIWRSNLTTPGLGGHGPLSPPSVALRFLRQNVAMRPNGVPSGARQPAMSINHANLRKFGEALVSHSSTFG